MSIMNIGVRALMANQGALQVISNNIANVNTPGYSRQSAILQTVPGQYTGSGYFGKGVDILTVQRSYSSFLTKQAAVTQSIAASDAARYDKLSQLESVFTGGQDGLGASINSMLNAFSDVMNAPTDLTARSVVLARADETATRFRVASGQLDDLRQNVNEQLRNNVSAVNTLADQIANMNVEISRAVGSGHTPNDLLDQRDQLINQLNKYIRTTNVPADNGSITVFVAGSQPLVMGGTASYLTVDPKAMTSGINDPAKTQLGITVGGVTHTLDPNMLGGGEMAGLLRFQNTDLVEAANMLGRMAQAIGTRMNEQQALGLDPNGNLGLPLFQLSALPAGIPSSSNTGTATVTTSIQTTPASGTTSFVASDYELQFTNGTTGTITRLSDGTAVPFDTAVANPLPLDGLNFQIGAGGVAGDRILLKPFSQAAASISLAISSPVGLAVANPSAASAGINNAGTLAIDSLVTRSTPPPATPNAYDVTLTFTGPGTYTRSDTGATVYTYTPGQPIEYDLGAPPVTGWSLTLKGVPQAGDTYAVTSNNPYPTLDAGNAKAMLNLRDLKMFDNGPLIDGYASLMASVGIKVQGAESAATVSAEIAASVEKNRSSVAGVNLDEEASKMLQYQSAYQAAGKMLQIAQNIFDTLIQSLGR
jgi:flagellar hook-associated protein 1 FlgK